MDPYPFAIERGIVDWTDIVHAVTAYDEDVETTASRFHATLTDMIVAVADHVGVEHVALTGGCFQNRRLTERTAIALRARGFAPLLHRQIPPNDGGISIGQLAVARSRTEARTPPKDGHPRP